MSKKTFLGEAQGRNIHDGKERKLAKLRPAQLSLFQTFLPEEDKYSNTIEFYNAVPKYFTNKRQMAEMREGPEGREIYLPTLEREFKYGCLGAIEHKTGLRKALDPKVPNHTPF